jgi:hypothetical protein
MRTGIAALELCYATNVPDNLLKRRRIESRPLSDLSARAPRNPVAEQNRAIARRREIRP